MNKYGYGRTYGGRPRSASTPPSTEVDALRAIINLLVLALAEVADHLEAGRGAEAGQTARLAHRAVR